ncbi:unnamed protein product [Pleuronectes platessa]|uniref:Uncharacterized protein n=1 Tax=Pleuronectes platessa TaxID=8262 RepID=A0A9N7UA52_PLEPL|nr:unnamed protein product [Pleuronectes platessa]
MAVSFVQVGCMLKSTSGRTVPEVLMRLCRCFTQRCEKATRVNSNWSLWPHIPSRYKDRSSPPRSFHNSTKEAGGQLSSPASPRRKPGIFSSHPNLRLGCKGVAPSSSHQGNRLSNQALPNS